MTDYAHLLQPDTGQTARAIHLVDGADYSDWLKTQPPRHRALLAGSKFSGKAGTIAILAGDHADDWSAIAGVESIEKPTPWCLARLAETLPEGSYRVEGCDPGAAMLGWAIAQYRFVRYKTDDKPTGPRVLLTKDLAQIAEIVRIAEAMGLTRDLINTPAADMGPGDLEAEIAKLATAHDAVLTVTKGTDLETGYPMIHGVGMAAAKRHAPRLIELEWGKPAHPRIAIVGKGVCFDSGGLDIKPASGMRHMKKDMGGAAHAIALAGLVIGARLPVRLHLLVAAVENAIAPNAFRPGDVLASRKGLTVEVANTDAEGRLVLGDALTRAAEDAPELILDFATLTGAARTALGPDLPALFANDDALANDLLACGLAEDDPLWRMPLWVGYHDMLKSDIADLNNSPEGGMAGAVAAALFLEKFVPKDRVWAHLDTFAWRSAAKPGRPKGGEALGLRASWAMLRQRYPNMA